MFSELGSIAGEDLFESGEDEVKVFVSGYYTKPGVVYLASLINSQSHMEEEGYGQPR
jgi:hypothetical protein